MLIGGQQRRFVGQHFADQQFGELDIGVINASGDDQCVPTETQQCDNKPAAVSFVVFMTNDESEMMEAQAGNLPTRTKTFEDVVKYFKENNKTALAEMFPIWQQSLSEARTPPLIPQWIEVSNVIWPAVQAAIVGQKEPKAALDEAAAQATTIMQDAGLLK